MKSLKIHGPLDLRIEDYPLDNLKPNQVEIKIAIGGICGTDLHYYKHGGFGQIKLREPMILGHEVSGFISKIGSNVKKLSIGQLVSVSPSRPCNKCIFCLTGNQIQCINMKFYGSAMPFPHIQGAFREILIVEDYQISNLKQNDVFDEGLIKSIFLTKDGDINLITNSTLTKSFLISTKNTEYKKLDKKGNEFEQYTAKARLNLINKIYQSYDENANQKYKVEINQRTIDRVKNSF